MQKYAKKSANRNTVCKYMCISKIRVSITTEYAKQQEGVPITMEYANMCI